jgi:carboxypeptidase C (cathepsin A)
MQDHDVTAMVSLLLQVPTLVAMAFALYWVSRKQDTSACTAIQRDLAAEIRALELRMAEKADRKAFEVMSASMTGLDIKVSRTEALLERVEGIVITNHESLRELTMERGEKS